MTTSRKLTVMFAALLLAAGLAACGGDDDDDTVVEYDTSEESTDDAVVEFDQVAFCAEYNEEDPRDEIPVDEVNANGDSFDAFAAGAPDEIAGDIQVLADLAHQVADEAEGDTVSSADAIAAAQGSDEAMASLQAIAEYCG